jgi:hypothetical protein
MRGVAKIWCCFSEPDAKRLASLFSTLSVQHEIARDPENPGPGITLVRRRFGEAPPDDKKCLSDHVLSIHWLRATLHELQQVGV